MTTITAEVIADSINPVGVRITTLKLVFPHIILPQVLTHRVFSRNAASSRAIPTRKMIERVNEDFYLPVWARNKRGMQPAGLIEDIKVIRKATKIWENAMYTSLESALQLAELGIAKEQVNRLLEPFGHVQFLVTSTDWENFFNLRLDHAAQSEIQQLAYEIKQEMDHSDPDELSEDEWHLPFVTKDERVRYTDEELLKISSARCCRVSYWLPEGRSPSFEEDVNRHDQGIKDQHWSPYEHPAMSLNHDGRVRNFRGWIQYRDFVDTVSQEGQQ